MDHRRVKVRREDAFASWSPNSREKISENMAGSGDMFNVRRK